MAGTSTEGKLRVLLQRVKLSNGYERLRNPEVIEVDAETGKTRMVQGSNPIVSRWDTDESGAARIGSGYERDTGKMRVLYRPSGDGAFRTIMNEKNERYDDPKIPAFILNGPARLWLQPSGRQSRALRIRFRQDGAGQEGIRGRRL